MPKEMTEWNKFKEKQPLHNEYVIIFRKSREKYSIGRLVKLEYDDGLVKTWVTEYGNCHKVDDEDVWLDFPNLIIKKVIQRKR